jgi:hypothetical protein
MLERLLQYWLDVAFKGHTSQNFFYFNGLAIVYFTLGLLFADSTLFYRRARNVCEKNIIFVVSVRPSASNNSASTGQVFIKCFVVDFTEICQLHLLFLIGRK